MSKKQNVKNTAGSYWKSVRQRFVKNRLAVWAFRWLLFVSFVAVFADFIANEKPLICKQEGQWSVPILRQYAIDLGIQPYDSDFKFKTWLKEEYEFVLFPLITYSSKYSDRRKNKMVSPFGAQKITHWRFRHWLGTDDLGRDVAAGLVAGTRVALLVGLLSMTIASVLGIFFGAVAGYFGDDRLKVTPFTLAAILIGLLLGYFYGFTARAYPLQYAENRIAAFALSFLLFLAVPILFGVLASWLTNRFPILQRRQLTFPTDLVIMRIVEVFNSIPALLLILAVIAIIQKPSIFYIMALLGLIRWTGIAKFIRSELLRIRSLEYIEAARAVGMNESRILISQAIPNAITPVLITIAFGIAGAILIEAALSFLGIGVTTGVVTWGTMLRAARDAYLLESWWLAIFPGIAIFITVTVFNLIGDGLSEAV